MKVIDASALAAMAFAEPAAPAVVAETEGEQLVAPELLPFELTNIALNKILSRPDAIDTIEAQLAGGLAMSVILVNVDFAAVFRLAAAVKLTAYDASYLWLSRQLRVPLVTQDKALRKTADGP